MAPPPFTATGAALAPTESSFVLVGILATLVILFAVAAAVLATRVLRDRAVRKQRNVFGRWPIPTRSLVDLDPRFRPGEFGPTRDAEVAFIGRGSFAVPGGTSDAEAWILATLARDATLAFEFGTCTGKTAYLWARNAPRDGRVVTLTLRPEDRASYQGDSGDDARDTSEALRESEFERFVYSGTDAESKIEQIYGDSKAIDVTPWAGRCDLVFVDGSHAYSYVVSDSRQALRLVRPGGLVLWHDYLGPRHSPGVYRALNELARELPLFHVAGTSFVAYRRPRG